MDGIHDMGGMHGFGPVTPEPNEPVFHADWERTAYAVMRACSAQGLYTGDEFRHGIERMPPAEYLASSYYARWLASIERLLIEKGVVGADEVAARVSQIQADPSTSTPARRDPALAGQVRDRATVRPGFERPGPAPRYCVGDRIRTRTGHPSGHTRLPRYARDKIGVIHQFRGCHVLPDANAHGDGAVAIPLYSVRFEGATLWGDAPDAPDVLYLDLWETYLEPDASVRV